MRISELSERSGVPIATVKYYLREGLLAPGEVLNARESAYSEQHLARLRLIRGMVHVLDASVMQVRDVLAIIDTPGQSPLEAMGKATSALPTIGAQGDDELADEPRRALGMLESLGYRYAQDAPGIRQLETALKLAESVGITLDDEQVVVYGDAARNIARADFARIPWKQPDAAIAFAVLGTALYEPVLLSLRRLAHHELGLALEAEYATDPDKKVGDA